MKNINPCKNNAFVKRARYAQTTAAFAFMLPSLAGITAFYIVPILITVKYSVSDVFKAGGASFVSLANYKSVLESSAFRLAAANSCKFLCACVPIIVLISLILAALINSLKKSGSVFKSTFLIPFAIPVASIVLLWRVLFTEKGIVNNVLTNFGIAPIDFMGTNAAFWVLVITYVWRNCGYDMLLWLTGLEGISQSLYEAAAVDGAGAFKSFIYITVPNLGSTGFLILILSVINSFKVFREAYLVAGNYPHESMYLLQHLFNNWFLSLDINRLSAAAVLLALSLTGFITALVKFWSDDK